MSRLAALVAMTRPLNSLSSGAATLLGGLIAVGTDVFTDSRTWIAAATATCIVAGTNVLNDVHDADTDRINRPDRAIPTGRVSEPAATAVGVGLFVAGNVIALTLGVMPFVVALALTALSQLYNVALKATVLWGNLAVAFLGGATITYGAWIAGSIHGRVLAAAALTFVYLFAYEVLTSVDDEAGDRAMGVRTIATEHPRRARRLYVALATAFAALAVAVGLATGPNRVFLLAVAVVVLGPLGASCVVLATRPTETRRALELAKAGWYLGLIALLALA